MGRILTPGAARARKRRAARRVPAPETFRQACLRLVGDSDVVTRDERLSRLRRYVWPFVGDITPAPTSRQISDLLADAGRLGLARTTLDHIRVDVSWVCGELVRDGVIQINPATTARVRVPRGSRDTRPRVILTDPELAALVRAPTTGAQLATMSVCSRALGGMRPSDLYAWTWDDVDPDWNWADVPRPKTEHHATIGGPPRARLALPTPVAAVLRAWWCPGARGPVFPTRIPHLAQTLRAALLRAGIDRYEVHHDTPTSRRADFYSFRRAWVTALAGSGLNAQTAMRLTGHRSMTTHQRYLVHPVLEIPAAAVPLLEKGF